MPKTGEKLGKVLTFQSDEEINSWLREQVAKQERSLGSVLRRIIRQYMEAEKRLQENIAESTRS